MGASCRFGPTILPAGEKTLTEIEMASTFHIMQWCANAIRTGGCMSQAVRNNIVQAQRGKRRNFTRASSLWDDNIENAFNLVSRETIRCPDATNAMAWRPVFKPRARRHQEDHQHIKLQSLEIC